MTKTIEVEVFGHRFSLQGEGDEAYFHELAEYVDTQMRTLAKQTKTSTPTKLAILAAINVTDELFRQQRHRESGETEMERRAQLLVERIDKHLETPPS
jgi:cell division protein ZapA